MPVGQLVTAFRPHNLIAHAAHTQLQDAGTIGLHMVNYCSQIVHVTVYRIGLKRDMGAYNAHYVNLFHLIAFFNLHLGTILRLKCGRILFGHLEHAHIMRMLTGLVLL